MRIKATQEQLTAEIEATRQMTRRLAAVAYWFAAVTITLGSIGHGFLGVKPVRTALTP